MKTKRLGNCDLFITTIGFDAWQIGGSGWEFGWGGQEVAEIEGRNAQEAELVTAT